jgi:hypothetical protein
MEFHDPGNTLAAPVSVLHPNRRRSEHENDGDGRDKPFVGTGERHPAAES